MCVYLIWTYWVLPAEAPSAVSVAGDSEGEVGLYCQIAVKLLLVYPDHPLDTRTLKD